MKDSKSLFLFSTIFLILMGCKPHREHSILRTADSLLWANPDSCVSYIQSHKNMIPISDSKRAELKLEHAKYKKNPLSYDGEDLLQDLSKSFITQLDYRSAGEAKYILGAHYVQIGNDFDATETLKEAESLYHQTNETPAILYGMLYFNLGIASERSRLFSVAYEYYKQALPYFKEEEKAVYLSATYHNLGKCLEDTLLALSYMDTALHYTQINHDRVYQNVIETTKYYITNPTSKDDLNNYIDKLTFLCDTCHYNSYAAVLARLHIEQGRLSEAEQRLQQLAQDTLLDIWNIESYHAIRADLLYQQGKMQDAYIALRQLHKRQTQEIESSAYNRTYIISQKYDAAKEREMRLRETVKKQWAYFGIAIFLLICCLIAAYTLYIYKKGQYELLISQEQQKQLQQELYTNRVVLRTRIAERLEVAKQLHRWSSHLPEPIPDILNILSPKQAASDQENWKRFYHEFNLCYDNILQQLKDNHPDLTDSDLQYIAITYMGFNITDISFLLGIGKRTIWNRRSSIKQHLALPEETNLDDWITNEMTRPIQRTPPKHRI